MSGRHALVQLVLTSRLLCCRPKLKDQPNLHQQERPLLQDLRHKLQRCSEPLPVLGESSPLPMSCNKV